MRKCDVCEKDATDAARDLREIDPTEDENGQKWRDWEDASDWRYGCDKHPPAPSRTFYLDGTSASEIQQMRLGQAWATALLFTRNRIWQDRQRELLEQTTHGA
jgi:hypothetical protein